MLVTKTTGKYPKDNLTKPDFSPIVQKNSEASSEYAKQLEQLPVQEVKPRFIDFQKRCETVSLTPLATLYATANPVTDIFTP